MAAIREKEGIMTRRVSSDGEMMRRKVNGLDWKWRKSEYNVNERMLR